MAITSVDGRYCKNAEHQGARVPLSAQDQKVQDEWARILSDLGGKDQQLLRFFASVVRAGGVDRELGNQEKRRAEKREGSASKQAEDAANPLAPRVLELARGAGLVASGVCIWNAGAADNFMGKVCELGAQATGAGKGAVEPRYQGLSTEAQNNLRVTGRDVDGSLQSTRKTEERSDGAKRSMSEALQKKDSQLQQLR